MQGITVKDAFSLLFIISRFLKKVKFRSLRGIKKDIAFAISRYEFIYLYKLPLIFY